MQLISVIIFIITLLSYPYTLTKPYHQTCP